MLQNGILHFAFKLSQSSRNRVSKLEFSQAKNERLKRLNDKSMA